MHKEHDLKLHQEKNATGLNIDNFIQTFNFNNVVLREKLALFLNYIEFFHKLHTKYFKRFTTKMQLFVSQINHDIKFEDSAELNKTKRKSMLDNFANDNIDQNILKDLKNSIVGDNQKTPTTPPSTPISGIFQSISDVNFHGKIDEEQLKEVVLKIEEQEEPQKQEEQEPEKEKEEQQKEEQEPEKEKEPEPSDDVSLLTTDSESKKDVSSLASQVVEPKPKRKYKPRKKKEDL